MPAIASIRGFAPWLIVMVSYAGAHGSEPPTATRAPLPSEYETVVSGAPTVRLGSREDPAAFSTRVRLNQADPGLELTDLLREVPGLGLRDYGTGQRKTLTLRAAEPHQMAIYLDGVPLTAPGRGHVDLSLFDPGLLDEVEVRRSGGSARFGHAAVGGVVLLRTRKLHRRRVTGASTGYGSWQTVHARASHAQNAGPWRLALGGSFRRSDGDFTYLTDTGQQQRRDNNDSTGGEALLKVDRRVADSWRIGLLNSFAATSRGAPGPSMNPSETARQGDVRNVTALQARRVGLLGESGRLDLSLYHRYDHFRFEEEQTRSNSDAFAVGTAADLVLPLHELIRLDGGVDLRGDFFAETNTGDRQRLAVDLFTSAQLALLSERIVLTPAVRLLTATEFDPALTPKLGLVLRPFGQPNGHWTSGFEILANAGRSYRYPTFQELYLRLEGLYPNPDLLPEDAWSLDAGFRWSMPRLLGIELAYYQRWLQNTILYAPTGSFRVTAENYSEVRANGVEASLDLEPGLCLAVKSAYTYTRTRFSDPERSLPGHPEHQLTGRLEWAGRRCVPGTWYRARGQDGRAQRGWWAFVRGLRVWGEAVAQSDMPLDRNNSETLFEEGRVLVALGGSYTHRWLTVAAHLRNLTDKRDAVDTIGFPLPPLNFFVSTTARF